MIDYLLTNGRIVDGSGNRWYEANLGVQRDKIAFIRKGLAPEARETVDAAGLVVAPGFIDMHSHSDLMLLVDNDCRQKVHQGVTTELIGQDGTSVFPVSDDLKGSLRRQVAGLLGNPDISWDWNSLGEYFSRLEKQGTGTNIAALLPYGQIRQIVMGNDDRPPSPDEIDKMQHVALNGVMEGAAGVSIGLIYPPCVYAEPREVSEVLRPAAREGVFLVSHIRNESDRLLEAVDEILSISLEAGMALHVSHLKAAGKPNWSKTGELLDRLDQARDSGHEVTFDQYPYPAASTMFGALFPPWAHAGGLDNLLSRLKDPSTRDRIMKEIDDPSPTAWENWVRSCGWEGIVVSGVRTEENKALEGRTVTEIAELRGRAPAEVACDLMLEEDGAVSMVMFWGHEEGVQQVMKHSCHMVGSDGLLGGKPHPRVYGTFPRVLGRYVRELNVLGLEDAVRRMTSFPAQRLGLHDRGQLKAGMYADITIFDPERIRDLATYMEPRQYPEGIEYVFVNGQPVVWQGGHTSRTPGVVLRG